MINVNQLTQQLRMLPDAVLQRVAQMYKQDPYILPMVVSEGMARKQLRMAGQARAAAPQPKVNDQAVASLGYTPEEVGIAALQAPNMQNMADGGIAGQADDMEFAQRSEPVVRMADGGAVARYQKGGDVKSRFIEQYRGVAEKVGAELGVDPDIILSQWGLESGWGTKTVGDYNLGNIKDVTGKGKKAFDKLEGSESAYKSYKSPEDFARDYTNLVKRNFPNAVGAGRDVGAFTEGLSKGKTGTYATDPDYGKKLAATLTNLVPVGTAQAAPATSGAPAQAPASAQIPGQTVSAPAAIPEGFFSRLGSDLGMSEETKRNIGNILMAPTPMGVVTAPARVPGELTGIRKLYENASRFFGPPSAARKLTPEEIAVMQRTAQSEAQAAQAAQSATRTAQESGATVEEAAYLADLARRTEAARQAKVAADKVPSAAEHLQLLQQAERAQNAARATQVVSPAVRRAQEAKQLTALGVATGAGAAQPAGSSMPAYDRARGQGAFLGEEYPTQLSKETKKEALDTAKEAIPAKQRKGFSNDDLIELGLRMMADPGTAGVPVLSSIAGAFGRAGLGALAARKEREKAEREEAKEFSEAKYREALSAQALRGPAELALIERVAKEKGIPFVEAMELIAGTKRGPVTEEALMKAWSGSPYLQMQYSNPQDYIKLMMASAGSTPVAMPQGVKVRQTG